MHTLHHSHGNSVPLLPVSFSLPFPSSFIIITRLCLPLTSPRAINSSPPHTVCRVAVSCVVCRVSCRREHRGRATEQRTRPQEPESPTALRVREQLFKLSSFPRDQITATLVQPLLNLPTRPAPRCPPSPSQRPLRPPLRHPHGASSPRRCPLRLVTNLPPSHSLPAPLAGHAGSCSPEARPPRPAGGRPRGARTTAPEGLRVAAEGAGAGFAGEEEAWGKLIALCRCLRGVVGRWGRALLGDNQ